MYDCWEITTKEADFFRDKYNLSFNFDKYSYTVAAASDESCSLPTEFIEHSLSKSELVLPKAIAIKAIKFLRDHKIPILGWEGWVKYPDGSAGHPPVVLGTTSLDDLTAEEVAELCIKTICNDHEEWSRGGFNCES